MPGNSISVIIPSYNGRDLLMKNIPSVLEMLEFVQDPEIIIVDDGSTDDTQETVNRNFPRIRMIRNPVNCGFAKSVNTGVKNAGGDLVFLLNNDISPDREYVVKLLPYFHDEATFGVMGKMVDSNSGTPLEGLKLPVVSGMGMRFSDIFVEKALAETFVPTMYLCGGNALIDRRKFLQLGGVSEYFSPFYYEDLDLSLRALIKGWKLYYEPEAVCYHDHSVTIKKNYSRDFIKRTARRNRLIIDYVYTPGFAHKRINYLNGIKFGFYAILKRLGIRSNYEAYREYFSRIKQIRKEKSGPAEAEKNKLKKSLTGIRMEIERMISTGAITKEFPGKD